MSTFEGFDQATAVRPVGEGRFSGQVVKGWDIAGIPHGGYLMALMARAAGAVLTQSVPISVSATYLSAPGFGPVELQVRVLRAGRRQSSAEVRLLQDGEERVHAITTFGTLADDVPETPATDLASPPPMPDPEHCPSSSDRPAGDGRPEAGLHRHLDLRLSPDTGWIHDRPSGAGVVDGWIRLRDRATDPLALLVLGDALPPSVFDVLGPAAGHTPTMQLTVHLFAHPTTDWVQARSRTRLIAGALLDEDCDLWDAGGRVLGTARQLALVRR